MMIQVKVKENATGVKTICCHPTLVVCLCFLLINVSSRLKTINSQGGKKSCSSQMAIVKILRLKTHTELFTFTVNYAANVSKVLK